MIKCRAILIGDNRLFLEVLSLILESDALTIAHTHNHASDLTSLLTTVDEQPNLIIWDSSADVELDVARWTKIHREFPKIGIVVLTDQISAARVDRALAAGVRGFLPKFISAGALRLALKLITLGENIATIPSGLARSWQETPAAPRPIDASKLPISLSSREAEVLQHLGAGATNRTIALELGIAEETIRVHVKALMRKINVHNRVEAAIWYKTHQF
jgi:two-component system nitrate/nitrite response regulator NarL